MTQAWTLSVDCSDPVTVAAFWKVALGYVDAPPPAGFTSWTDWFERLGVPREEWHDGAAVVDPDGRRPNISFLKVPEPKRVKNRMHLDIQAGGGRGEPWDVRWPRVTATVDRLVAAGATVVREYAQDGVPDHVLMADPEGNEFCVV